MGGLDTKLDAASAWSLLTLWSVLTKTLQTDSSLSEVRPHVLGFVQSPVGRCDFVLSPLG